MPYCVKIQTGSGSSFHEGFLEVSIDGVIKVPKTYFKINQVVIEACFETFDNIKVTNENTDAWKGSITVKIDGADKKLSCDKCTGRSFENEVVVDGNGDSSDQAPTHCLNGESCSFIISGKISCYFIGQFKCDSW